MLKRRYVVVADWSFNYYLKGKTKFSHLLKTIYANIFVFNVLIIHRILSYLIWTHTKSRFCVNTKPSLKTKFYLIIRVSTLVEHGFTVIFVDSNISRCVGMVLPIWYFRLNIALVLMWVWKVNEKCNRKQFFTFVFNLGVDYKAMIRDWHRFH